MIPRTARPVDAVVLLHGLGECSFVWDRVAPRVRARALAHNLPFHGGRPADRAASFDALVDDVFALADERGFGRFGVAGTSLGGSVAMACTKRSPERIAAALFVAPVWRWRDASHRATLAVGRVGQLVARRGLPFAWRVVSGLPPISRWSPNDIAAYREQFMAFDPEAMARIGELTRFDRDRVRPLPAGHYGVVAWSDDAPHPLPSALALADAVRCAYLHVQRRPPDLGAEVDVLATAVDMLFA